MLIYQWSASSRGHNWNDVRALITEFTRHVEGPLSWPRGSVMVNRGCGDSQTVQLEFPFHDAKEFEHAWKRMCSDRTTGQIWARMHPLLDEASIERSVFEVQYSRAARTTP